MEKYKKIVSKLLKNNLKRIVYTGGEPCLHSKFSEIIEWTASKKLKCTVISNGYLYEKYKILFKYSNFVHRIVISVDGLEKEHDKNRQKGSFKKIIEAIDFYNKLKIKVSINLLITPYNYTDLPTLLALFQKKKIKFISLAAVIKNGVNDNLFLEMLIREKIIKDITKYRGRFKMKIRCSSSFMNNGGVEFCPVLHEYSNVNIDTNGNYIYCCDIIAPFGIIYDAETTSLKKFISKKMEITQKIRDQRLLKILSNKILPEDEYTCNYCNKYFRIIRL